VPLATIVIPTLNAEETIGRNLNGIFSQKSDIQPEVIVIDSSSSDRTVEIAAQFPVRLEVIDQKDFHHGKTRNYGASLGSGEFIVFLQGDAWPENEDWLQNLIQPMLDDPVIDGVYGRQTPREDCDPINRFRYLWNYPDKAKKQDKSSISSLKYRSFFFSTANCAVRRSVWEKYFLPDDIPIFEDTTFARLLITDGGILFYEPEAKVVHSHNLRGSDIFSRYRSVAEIHHIYLFNQSTGKNFSAEGLRYVKDGMGQILKTSGPLWASRFLMHSMMGYLGLIAGKISGRSKSISRRALRSEVRRRHYHRMVPLMEGKNVQPIKIHMITNLFHPDQLAGANLFTDFAEYLKEKGHDIRVTTTFPYYPSWKLAAEDVGVKLREEQFRGIPLRRIGMHVPGKPNALGRLISDFSFLASLLRRGKFPGWKPDVVFTACPMFSQSLSLRFMYPGKEISKLVQVQDFVVDAALELGILKPKALKPFLIALERFALRSAQTLTTISEPMLEKLILKVGPDRRLMYMPNWIHSSIARQLDRQKNRLPDSYRQGSFTLLYAGNIGVKQGLGRFLEYFPAESPHWRMEIYGAGATVDDLIKVIRNKPSISLGNVLNEREYAGKLLQSSAALVTQMPGVGANFLPSKLLPALHAGCPILAVCEEDSPLGREVLEGGFGEILPPDQTSQLPEILTRWSDSPDQLQAYAERAREWAWRYSRENVLPYIESELLYLVGKGVPGDKEI